jgi:hypothetical protein
MSASQRVSPLFTAIVVLAVGAAVLSLQVRGRGGLPVGGAEWFAAPFSHGWPTTAMSRIESLNLTTRTTNAYTDFDWSPVGTVVNVMVLVILLAGTAVACELWRRRTIRAWQFNLRNLLAFLTIAAILLALWQNDVWLSQQLAARIGTSDPYLNDGIRNEPWYVQVPIFFGLGCVIYSAGWMATKLLLAYWTRSIGTSKPAEL